jgi:hypothetical protein
MSAAAYEIHELDEANCRSCLAAAPMGRLGLTDAALPRILPVNFLLRQDDVVIGSRDNRTLARAIRGDVVAFEVDHYDPATGEGWGVDVIGTCCLITDPAAISQLDAKRIAPWTSSEGLQYFAITISRIEGRRLVRRGAPVGQA